MRLRRYSEYSFITLVTALVFSLSAGAAFAQTTLFKFHGHITDESTGGNGNYDLQLALWDSASGGVQIGSTQTINAVAVTNGDFIVTLDFGAGSFNGADRFIEISARLSSSGNPFVVQTPRPQVTSAPYAIRSLSAASADNVTVTGVPSGSGNYIQNSNTPQPASNFNISGNGTAMGTLSAFNVNADKQFNMGGQRALSGNLGAGNIFVGEAGNNSVNYTAGNSFVGAYAGQVNSAGSYNSFFGRGSGLGNTTGGSNSFFGLDAGGTNQTGSVNTLIGTYADVGSPNLDHATAIGAEARVDQSNSLVLGGITGVGLGQDTNVGIGTSTPRSALEVKRNWNGSFGAITVTGDRPTIRFSGGPPANNDQWIIHLGSAAGSAPAGSLSFFFGGTAGTSYGTPAFSVTPNKTVQIPNLAAGGSTQLCRNAANEIAGCSSSLRYKTNIASFAGGMNIINRLRPISFEWKQNLVRDIGLGAEEVAKVEPLLTFRNDQGEIEGVKYNQLSAVFINAFKEQQAQIEALRRANLMLNARLRNLEQRRQNKTIDRRRHRTQSQSSRTSLEYRP